MVEKQPRLYSAKDAMNSRAVNELCAAIEAIPIKSLKPSKPKGNVYLVKFHESTSTCFISRLPTNLIRDLISYNTVSELIALSLTCSRFTKFLFDKYISFNGTTPEIGFYATPSFNFQEYYDLLRISELTTGGRKIKVYGSVRPEFTGIFFVNSRVDLFYSYSEGNILEGTFVNYCDDMRIVSSRPCIQNVVATDVCGDTIACVSSSEIALSFAASGLRVARFETQEAPFAVKFIAGKRMLLVHKNREFELYLLTLHRTCVLHHEGNLHQLYIPDPARSTFATLSSDAIVSYSVTGIGEIHKQFSRERKVLEPFPSDFIMHRVIDEEHHYDFLFTLVNGQLLMNGELLEYNNMVWNHIRMVDGRLFASNWKKIAVFEFHKNRHAYRFSHVIGIVDAATPHKSPSTVIVYYRMKLVCAHLTPEHYQISYYHPDAHGNATAFATVSLPYMENISAKMMHQVLLVTGEVTVEQAEERWPVKCAFVVDFNSSAMLVSGPRVDVQAAEMVERRIDELTAKKMKKMQLKRLEKEEKAKKKEELQNKHRPKC